MLLPIVVIVLYPSTVAYWIKDWLGEISGLFNGWLWPFNELKSIIPLIIAFLVIGCILLVIPFVFNVESPKKFRGWGIFTLIIGALPFIFALLNIVLTGFKPVLAIVGVLFYFALTITGVIIGLHNIKNPSDHTKQNKPNLEIDKIVIEDGLEDSLAKTTALCLANELKSHKLFVFPSMLDDSVTQVIYNEKQYNKINGKQQIILYWDNWLKEQNACGATHKYSIIRTKFFSTEALQIEYWEGTFFVVFSLNNHGKIQYILVMNKNNFNTNLFKGPINSPYYNDALKIDQQMPEFWNNL